MQRPRIKSSNEQKAGDSDDWRRERGEKTTQIMMMRDDSLTMAQQ
jgi:hypothetical protein